MTTDPYFWLDVIARHWLTIGYAAVWMIGIFVVGRMTDRRA